MAEGWVISLSHHTPFPTTELGYFTGGTAGSCHIFTRTLRTMHINSLWSSSCTWVFPGLSVFTDSELVATATDTAGVSSKNKRAEMPDSTSPLKSPSHGLYAAVHTLMSPCEVGQHWGCLLGTTQWSVQVWQQSHHKESNKKVPQINSHKKDVKPCSSAPCKFRLFSTTPGKQNPEREFLLLRLQIFSLTVS